MRIRSVEVAQLISPSKRGRSRRKLSCARSASISRLDRTRSRSMAVAHLLKPLRAGAFNFLALAQSRMFSLNTQARSHTQSLCSGRLVSTPMRGRTRSRSVKVSTSRRSRSFPASRRSCLSEVAQSQHERRRCRRSRGSASRHGRPGAAVHASTFGHPAQLSVSR